MKTYRKGFRVERELAEMFSAYGFSVVRAAGSGYFTPDILAFKGAKQFAFEVKAHEKERLYISAKQLNALREWEANTSIPTYIAWRKARREFLFIPLHALKANPKTYVLSYEDIIRYGLRIEDLIYGI